MKNLIKYIIIIIFANAVLGQTIEYHLLPGWNLIGGGNIPVSTEYLDTLDGIISPIYRYNVTTKENVEADSLRPLAGYWVLAMDSIDIGEETCDCPPTVTDIDGNVYETVLIGDQCWMAENLMVIHYRNGEPIPEGYGTDSWPTLSYGAYCRYHNDSRNVEIYGLLYNWLAVACTDGLAPVGWHIPSEDEWKELEIFLGMDTCVLNDINFRGTNEGSKLAGGGELWEGYFDLEADPEFNSSGFRALPGGQRWHATGGFVSIHNLGYFWSSTNSTDYSSYCRFLYSRDSGIGRGSEPFWSGLSVRCVKD